MTTSTTTASRIVLRVECRMLASSCVSIVMRRAGTAIEPYRLKSVPAEFPQLIVDRSKLTVYASQCGERWQHDLVTPGAAVIGSGFVDILGMAIEGFPNPARIS